MSDQYLLSGGYTVTPLASSPSLDPSLDATLNESLVIKSKEFASVHLTTDVDSGALPPVLPTPVPFGTVANAHIVTIKIDPGGGKVKVRLTSADGALQIIPVDSYLLLQSVASPITAIDLTRTAGVDTIVRVFLGEKS
jgi:hypothetical protein